MIRRSSSSSVKGEAPQSGTHRGNRAWNVVGLRWFDALLAFAWASFYSLHPPWSTTVAPTTFLSQESTLVSARESLHPLWRLTMRRLSYALR